MILVIDNYDSFVYNLVQYLGALGQELSVVRNDQVEIEDIRKMQPSCIIISPGPGVPKNAGISCAVIAAFGDNIPILGVCLGHQSIAEVYGARVIRSECVVHGKTSEIYHDGETIFQGVVNPFSATRYHSLIVDKKSLPDCLRLSAWTEDGLVMGIRHNKYNIEGVQFHPESILTEMGRKILNNFLKGV
jgi:para-aminobenzoate synthetase component 2